MKKIGLLPRIIAAIVLGLALGKLLPLPCVRVFATFNYLFGQFLAFIIPLVIIGLVVPAIGDIGRSAGKLLVATVAIAYLDTLLAGLLAYGTGELVFPSLITSAIGRRAAGGPEDIAPFFKINIPAMCDVMSALAFAFLVGLGIAYGKKSETLKSAAQEFRGLVEKALAKAIIPLLPVYIFGIFLMMTATGGVFGMLYTFAKVIAVIFALHIVILVYEFAVAGAMARRNPLKLLWTMLPAYMTALGTSSSAATIPVTLAQTKKNGVSDEIAGFTVPLCATIHLSGSTMKITACALALCMIKGVPHAFPLFLEFVALLGIMMVAAPGVPGGAIMAALAPLGAILGFNSDDQAFMIALYIAMDSFGTACNVTGDGAIAIAVQKLFAPSSRGKSAPLLAHPPCGRPSVGGYAED